MKWVHMKRAISMIYTYGVSLGIAKWAISAAYVERGYNAIGGEYMLIAAVAVIAYMIICNLLNLIERGEDY